MTVIKGMQRVSRATVEGLRRFFAAAGSSAEHSRAWKRAKRLRRDFWRSLRRHFYPWLRGEIEICLKISSVILLSVWAKRLVEQFLQRGVINESIVRGRLRSIVEAVEEGLIS